MQQRIEDRDIWPDLLKEKDDLSLRQMGERYGVAPSAIVAAFKRQGITRRPAPSGPRSHRRREEPRARNSRGSGGPASRAPAPRPQSKDASILPFWSDLGRVPDDEIARRARVPVSTVHDFREHHEIPEPPAKAGGRARTKRSGPRETPSVRRSREIQQTLQPFDHLLGKLPDSEIARLSGLSLQAVRHQRQRRRIQAAGKLPRKTIEAILQAEGLSSGAPPRRPAAPAAAPSPRPPAPAPEASAPAAPALAPHAILTERQAWRVNYEGAAEVIVVAPSFLDAAKLADSHANGGRITTIEALGAAIAS